MTKCQFPTQIVTAECHGRIHIYIILIKVWTLGKIDVWVIFNPQRWFIKSNDITPSFDFQGFKRIYSITLYIYIHKSIYLPIYLSIYLSIYLFIYLSIFVYIYIACFLHVCILHCIVYIHEFHHFHWFFNAVACFKKRNIVFSVSRWFFITFHCFVQCCLVDFHCFVQCFSMIFIIFHCFKPTFKHNYNDETYVKNIEKAITYD